MIISCRQRTDGVAVALDDSDPLLGGLAELAVNPGLIAANIVVAVARLVVVAVRGATDLLVRAEVDEQQGFCAGFVLRSEIHSSCAQPPVITSRPRRPKCGAAASRWRSWL